MFSAKYSRNVCHAVIALILHNAVTKIKITSTFKVLFN